MREELIEQKIVKEVTILAGASGSVSVTIPQAKTVFLQGYGYSWFTLNTFSLSTGNTQFPNRTDQEGSISIPRIFGKPFMCRPGGTVKLSITNADASAHTYQVMFIILTNELLDEPSAGTDLIVGVGGSGGGPLGVFIQDQAGTIAADVITRTDGLKALVVDTEITIDAATFNITNLKVASTDQSALGQRYIKCDTDGTIWTRDIPFTAITNGATKTIAVLNTPEVLGASTAARLIRVRGTTVTGTIFIGGSAVSPTIYLDSIVVAGQSFDYPVDNVNDLFVYGNAGDQVDFVVLS